MRLFRHILLHRSLVCLICRSFPHYVHLVSLCAVGLHSSFCLCVENTIFSCMFVFPSGICCILQTHIVLPSGEGAPGIKVIGIIRCVRSSICQIVSILDCIVSLSQQYCMWTVSCSVCIVFLQLVGSRNMFSYICARSCPGRSLSANQYKSS